MKFRQPDPVYVPHGPITADIANELLDAGVWTCREDTPASREPGRRPTWSLRTGMTAQCQCCQGVFPVRKGRIVAHDPADPTLERCQCGEYYNDEREPVYMGKETAPICERCAMAEPTGWDEDGRPVHGAPDVGTTAYD